MGCSGCSTMIENTPAEQNSWGGGLDSRWLLGFFLLFLSLSCASLIRSLKEVQHYIFSLTKEWMFSCAAWGKTKHNMLWFGTKKYLKFTFKVTVFASTNLLVSKAAIKANVSIVKAKVPFFLIHPRPHALEISAKRWIWYWISIRLDFIRLIDVLFSLENLNKIAIVALLIYLILLK